MDETRTCTECGAKMTQGYCVNGGEEYYCTDECLHKHYTPEEREEMYGDGDTDSYRTEREEERPAREQLHADCHRQEARKTPAGEVRIATINANMHPDGKIGRDAVAHRHA